MDNRKCNACGIIKSLTCQYFKHDNGPKFMDHCRKCDDNGYGRKYTVIDGKIRVVPKPRKKPKLTKPIYIKSGKLLMKLCKGKCSTVKLLSEYGILKRNPDGLNNFCRCCWNAYATDCRDKRNAEQRNIDERGKGFIL